MIVLGLVLALAIGISLGLLGGGGSILTVPVLHYVIGIEAHDAIATSLVVVGLTSMVALVPHARAKAVQWRLGVAFGGASMASAFLGGRLGELIPSLVLIIAFAVVMLAAGIAMLVRARRPLLACDSDQVSLPRVLVIGVGVGLVTGTLGAGGGFIIVPALALVGGLGMREAVGTSLLVIAMNSFAGVAGTASHATIDLKITVGVTAVAIVGSLVGVLIGRRLAAQHLQRAFGWFVIIVGIAILFRELG
ncbi:MAG TPA: sulfite exporter TauE/SafE family protein [Kofleriaceae bacterium]|nr:sulfite exporter TauE/SafE family protein [Kofleriaceae bacterium]